ncbi:protein of unknown function [Asanoa hainanensis]|uniref:DUF4394 domain-containing protein n=1 Tax=Asanoa hainanensis TaxID=560556 RepID=A0A239NKD3_9ACTN|nr:DUF4394 domain-containing protein [Asanoa hainanensis]SNT55351.1 protein of unknown function [Asanoa hainanensis]
MRKKMIAGVLAAAGAVAAGTLAIGALRDSSGSAPADALLVGRSQRSDQGSRIVGLTRGGDMVSFRADRPGDARRIGMVKGLTGDTRLVGLDFRVQDGKLYGVGNQGGIYTLNTSSARATQVSQLTVPLAGTRFGVDFNPAANRLRVVSDTGQNLRHNLDDAAGAPATGTTAMDTTLTVPPAATAVSGVTAAAYTNNDLDATTATTLFDLNTTTDQILVQSPANQGELAPTGALGVDATGDAGLDIGSGNTAYATLKVDGRQRFYRVSLLTGRANLIGSFDGKTPVTDIAVTLDK